MIVDIPVVKHSNKYYSTPLDRADKFIVTYEYNHPTTLKRGYKQTPWKFTATFDDGSHTHITGRARTLNELKKLAYIHINFVFNKDEIWKLYSIYGNYDEPDNKEAADGSIE